MKSKWNLIGLICSIGQLVIGLSAIIAFIILSIGDESMTEWLITLILSVAFVILGICGIKNYKSQK